jgi:hypothetical protein
MKLFLIVIAVLAMASAAYAVDLVTDPMTGVLNYEVDVDGAVVVVPAETDGSLKFNVDGLNAGAHVFKVRPEGEGGWPATWSDPFNATKPQIATGIRLAP